MATAIEMVNIYLDNLWLLASVVAMFGAMLGSFANVVAYRLPRMLEAEWAVAEYEAPDSGVSNPPNPNVALTLSRPSSHCPSCTAAIPMRYNIPIFGWLFTGGKCFSCKQAISKRYPLVEAVTAGLSAATVLMVGPQPELVGALAMTWFLVPLALIDRDHMLLPDAITGPMLWSGALLSVMGLTFVAPSMSIVGAAFGYLMMKLIAAIAMKSLGREALGAGDAKLIGAIGAFMGIGGVLTALLIASLALVLADGAMRVMRIPSKGDVVSFGPYIAAGAWASTVGGMALLLELITGPMVH